MHIAKRIHDIYLHLRHRYASVIDELILCQKIKVDGYYLFFGL
jgi:hypothetical protein